jgi:hypothetical protein
MAGSHPACKRKRILPVTVAMWTACLKVDCGRGRFHGVKLGGLIAYVDKGIDPAEARDNPSDGGRVPLLASELRQ